MSIYSVLHSVVARPTMNSPVFPISSAVRRFDEGGRCGDINDHRYLADSIATNPLARLGMRCRLERAFPYPAFGALATP